MDIVLEEVCAELPNGGGHESRKFIAEQLIRCARSGNALGVAEQPWVNWVSAGARAKSSVPVAPRGNAGPLSSFFFWKPAGVRHEAGIFGFYCVPGRAYLPGFAHCRPGEESTGRCGKHFSLQDCASFGSPRGP